MACLGHADFGGLDGVRTILGGVGGGKSRSSGIVVRFYSLDPSGIDGKSCRSVVEAEPGLNYGQIVGAEGHYIITLYIVRDGRYVISGEQ